MADLFKDDKQLAIVREQHGDLLEQIFTRVAMYFKPATLEFLALKVLSANWDPEAAAQVRERVGSWLSLALADLQDQWNSFQGNTDHLWHKHAAAQGWLAKWEEFISTRPPREGYEPKLCALLQMIDSGTKKMDDQETARERREE